jgi:hypothetical protein
MDIGDRARTCAQQGGSARWVCMRDLLPVCIASLRAASSAAQHTFAVTGYTQHL